MKPRLLVLIVAYYAESTLWRVLERIPKIIFKSYDCEILVVDDASEDRTFQIGCEYKSAHPEVRVTVLRNQYNQGYGGNQKVGYSYAINEGFDFVAMVHGDGQYAPEELPRLVKPLADGKAELVMGSRMLRPFDALKGGMPLYKFVGNRVLTAIQNFLLRSDLSEFHSGYRVYSVRALAGISFVLNSNDFHFDTEIILQFLNAGFRIQELPIPTYYGGEICRVNGMRYALNVIRVTLHNVFHRLGLLYQRRLDTVPDESHYYDLKLGYPSSHTYAIEAVKPGAKVVDIGAGPFGLTDQLIEKGCEVGIVVRHLHADPHPGVSVHLQDLDEPLRCDLSGYDHILLLDVIEHLHDPELFLKRLRAQFDHRKRTLILTTGNVAFIVQRLMLLLGQFNYGKTGVLDRTHTRLFNFRSIRHLLRDYGFQIRGIRGIPAPFPKVLGLGRLGRSALRLNLFLISLSKTLFSYQIFIEATSTPSVEFVLRDAKESSPGLGTDPCEHSEPVSIQAGSK